MRARPSGMPCLEEARDGVDDEGRCGGEDSGSAVARGASEGGARPCFGPVTVAQNGAGKG